MSTGDKRAFVRFASPILLLAQLLRREEKPDAGRAIAFSERLWERLVAAGYGPARARGPNPVKDQVAALSPALRDSFERLWAAYGVPKGKQEAASRWAQIAPDADLAQRIVAAAVAEARATRPEGQARKWLQGWLSERRWEDSAPAPGQASDEEVSRRRVAVAELLIERKRLLREARLSGGEGAPGEALAQIDRQLAAYGVAEPDGRPRQAEGPQPVSAMLRPPSVGETDD